jgi:predicted nucleic acid-binding protein
VVLKRVLDTNAVLYFLGGRLSNTLPDGDYFVSVITEMELLSYPSLDSAAETQIRWFLLEITVVPLSRPVIDLAIALRREHAMKLPDAVIAATLSAWTPRAVDQR